MESLFLVYKNSHIHYRKSGRGQSLLVCFHGFAETAESFDLLEDICGDLYSIYAFDLPFHGKTTWEAALNFEVHDLVAILQSCPGIADHRLNLMGYSMGGRVVLSLYQAYPEKIDSIILLASDGLIVNPWYKFATRTLLGNRIFKQTMQYPGWFLLLLNIGDRIGAVNAGVSKFVRKQIDNPEMRKKIYMVWTAMRDLRPDTSVIKQQILQHKTQVCLIFGKYDRVIKTNSGRQFMEGIESYSMLSEIESGHQLLNKIHADTLSEVFHYFFNSNGKRSL